MKKIFSAILSFFIVSYMAVPVFAANVSYLDNELPDFVPADDEINQEVIDKYGISSTDEFGNEVIIIPMVHRLMVNISNRKMIIKMKTSRVMFMMVMLYRTM